MGIDVKGYVNFDLSIDKVGRRYRARATTPDGAVAFSEFSRPFTPDRVQLVMLQLGRTRALTRAMPDRVPASEIEVLHGFGQALLDKVFIGDLRMALERSLSDAHRQDLGLRIRLRLGSVPELADLPWELLATPAHSFFALSKRTPIVRYLELPEAEESLAISGALRMLVIVSNPTNSDVLDVEAEWQKLNAGLSDLVAAGQLTIDRLAPPTLSELRLRLERSRYHILHFIGHGAFDPRGQAGLLLFSDESNAPRTVTGEDFATILDDHSSLRLAVLNSCEGSRAGTKDPFAGTAQTLVRRGLPAVIAMQFEITDTAAKDFARGFYSAIGAGYPVDAAVSEGRKEIVAKGNHLEWGTPSLFMRTGDGQIFDIPDRDRIVAPPAATEVVAATAASAIFEAPDDLPTDAEAGPVVPDPVLTGGEIAAAPEAAAIAEPSLVASEIDEPPTLGVPHPPTAPPTLLPTSSSSAASLAIGRGRRIGLTKRRVITIGIVAAVGAAGLIWVRTPVIIAPSELDFGLVDIGDTNAEGLPISTLRVADLDSLTLDGADSGSFQITECADPSINLFKFCIASVSFTPTRTGDISTELTIGSGLEMAYVWLHGVGEDLSVDGASDPTTLAADPSSVEFREPSGLVERVITVTNGRDKDASLGKVALNDPNGAFEITSDECSRVVLSTGDSCSIHIRYPGSGNAGDLATLTIPTDDKGSALRIQLTGGEANASP